MKKVLIVSDTHGDNRNFEAVLDKVGQPDFFIHCGDLEGSAYYYEHVLKCEKAMVSGNNDWTSGLRSMEYAEINGFSMLIVHGHRYGVHYGTEALKDLAVDNAVSAVLYGHTHVPDLEYDDENDIWIANPGSLSYPRQDGRRPSYILLEIEDDGTPHFTINYL